MTEAPGHRTEDPLKDEANQIRTEQQAVVERQLEVSSLNDFRILEEIGSGATAKVHVCQQISSGQQFAVKVFRKGLLKRQKDWSAKRSGGMMKARTALDKVYEEVRILRRIVHQNCVVLHAIYDEADEFGKLFLIVEYAAGGASMNWFSEERIFKSPSTGGTLPESVAKALVINVLSGLSYLHRSRIAHRDIKPPNVLVYDDGSGKIADFGVSCETDEDGNVFGTEGTYPFYSPEMCGKSGYSGHDGRRADVWALGVTLWAYLFGIVPFSSPDAVELFEEIAKAELHFPEGASNEIRGTLRRLLAARSCQRPLAWELGDDTWLHGG